MILIVTGGRTPSKDLLFEYLDKASYIIAADSGCEVLLKNNIHIDLLVGDFDSVDEFTKNNLIRRIETSDNSENLKKYKTQKDFTDSEAALREAINLYPDEDIVMLGAIGTRMDHTLCNMGLFRIAKCSGRNLSIIDENNIIRVIDKPCIIEKKRKFISFSAYDEEVRNFSIRGFKYPLNNYTLKIFDLLNVSNEFIENEGSISFEEGKNVIVIQSND